MGRYISASAGGITSVLDGCLRFLSLCSSGFQGLLRLKPPSLLMLLGCVSISVASLMRRCMSQVLEERKLAVTSLAQYPI